jgi:hypothetical protein
MPTLFEDFFNASYLHALTSSIIHGLQVLLVIGTVGGALTFLTGGTQPKHWPKSEH